MEKQNNFEMDELTKNYLNQIKDSWNSSNNFMTIQGIKSLSKVHVNQ